MGEDCERGQNAQWSVILDFNVKRSPQNTDIQCCFSMPCLFVLISHLFKPLTEIKTNEEQIETEEAKTLRTMTLGKIYWFLQKKACSKAHLYIRNNFTRFFMQLRLRNNTAMVDLPYVQDRLFGIVRKNPALAIFVTTGLSGTCDTVDSEGGLSSTTSRPLVASHRSCSVRPLPELKRLVEELFLSRLL